MASLRQIIFDTETTGFDPKEGHRIVEIGAMEMVAGSLTGETFHCYVNPERDMPEGAFKVHGLSAEFLSQYPVFADEKVGKAFRDFIGDDDLIAHNAKFDKRFIDFEFDRASLPPAETNEIIDTLEIARAKYPGAQNSLDALCKRFEISLASRDKHGALIDTELLAAVYIELTGGRQQRLGLSPEDSVNPVLANSGGPLQRRQRQRPTPLPPRITEEESQAHAKFLEDFAAEALWARFQSNSN